MEILGDLVEALGLILGSFMVATGLSAAAWAIFVRAHHPEWGEPATVLALILALTMRLVGGEFFSMVTILMVIATPFMWIEGRAWRGRRSGERQRSSLLFHKFW